MTRRIVKLVKDGLYKEAILLFMRHHSASVPPSNFTFPYILKACAALRSIAHAQMLQAHLLKSGFTNKHVTTDLTNMYMKLGLVESAAKLFEKILRPNLSILNVVISGFLQNGLLEESFCVFKKHGVHDLRFDSITVASVVSACRDVVNGAQLHCFAVKTGVAMVVNASTSIMTMYFNCGELDSAVKLFRLIDYKNVVCYNACLSGLIQNGAVQLALEAFNEMRSFSLENPNAVTMISVLSGCGSGKCARFGRQLHGLILKFGFKFDANVGTGLVDMYSKCGLWECAYDVFKETRHNCDIVTWNSMIAGMMLNDQNEKAINLFVELQCEEELKPDLATWNSMISGFMHLGKPDDAILFFRKMLSCGVLPNVWCITSLLSACSSLSDQCYGRQIHSYVVRMRLLNDGFLATAIIDMYMKCELPSLAYNIFNQFDVKPTDPAFWNAMIFGYGRNRMIKAALYIFKQMIENRVKPNSVTFTALLSVCSQTGQADEGFRIFRVMAVGYGLNPTLKQMNILIDLLNRSGRLEEAFEPVQSMDESFASAFASLLRASEDYSDSRVEPENSIPFAILSNI